MKSLVLDTSTNLLYISFIENDKVIYEVKTLGMNNHSDHLIELIKEGLVKLSLEVKDFDRIIIGVGPGAYTGLRVSMSVAKMFAWTLNIPLYEISSLDLLTSGYKDDGKYLVCFKAKKGHVYNKSFIIEDNQKVLENNESFMSDEEVNEKYNKDEYVVITNENMNIDCLNIEAEIKKVDNIHALEPNYLREC